MSRPHGLSLTKIKTRLDGHQVGPNQGRPSKSRAVVANWVAGGSASVLAPAPGLRLYEVRRYAPSPLRRVAPTPPDGWSGCEPQEEEAEALRADLRQTLAGAPARFGIRRPKR
jgi:hypothetical protein